MTIHLSDRDWNDVLDDQGPEYWEQIGWPDDSLIEDQDRLEPDEFWEEPELPDEYETGPEEDATETEWEAPDPEPPEGPDEERMNDLVAWERYANQEMDAFPVPSEPVSGDRPRAILAWLESSELARPFRSRSGFYVRGGSTVVLLNGRELDAILWLLSEGFLSGTRVDGYEVSYSGPDSPWGERLSFFPYRVEAPF